MYPQGRRAVEQPKRNRTMTKNEFTQLCCRVSVDPGIALENEDVVEALRRGATREEIKELLETQF